MQIWLLQKELLYGARVYVLPSTSGANATGRRRRLRHFRKTGTARCSHRAKNTSPGATDGVPVSIRHNLRRPDRSILEEKHNGIAALV